MNESYNGQKIKNAVHDMILRSKKSAERSGVSDSDNQFILDYVDYK